MTQRGDTALELSGVTYRYPDGRRALAGIDLTVAAGETLIVIGPNGAGKSSLLMALNGLVMPDGEIKVFGRLLARKNLAEIRREVGLVFQDPDDQLFMPTVREDIAFGPVNMGLDKHEIDHRVEDALAMVGLSGFGKRLSHHLSYGEKKLVSIAGVLAMEPRVLVLDEPTANLDPRAKRGLVAILTELPQTKVVSTHDMNVAWLLADRVALIYEGRIVRDGPAREVLTDEKLLLKYGLELPTLARGS